MSRFMDEQYDPQWLRAEAAWDQPTKAELDAEAREDARRPRTPLHPIVAEQIAELFPAIDCQDCGSEHRADCATCHPF